MEPTANAAIVIPHHNDETRLELLLDSIRSQTGGRKLAWEIVVVDDKSADPRRARAVAESRGAHFLHGNGGGSYAARNLGILRVASARGVIFTDSDCVFTGGTLAAYEDWLLGPDRRLLASGPITLFPRDPAAPTRWEVLDMGIGLPQEQNVREKQVAVTANLGVRAEAFTRFGMFNDQFRSGGDIEFTNKIARIDGGIAWLPDAAILHPARSSRDEHIKKVARVQRGVLARELSGKNRSEARGIVLGRLGEACRPPLRAWRSILAVRPASLPCRLGACLAMVEWKWARVRFLLAFWAGEHQPAAARLSTLPRVREPSS